MVKWLEVHSFSAGGCRLAQGVKKAVYTLSPGTQRIYVRECPWSTCRKEITTSRGKGGRGEHAKLGDVGPYPGKL